MGTLHEWLTVAAETFCMVCSIVIWQSFGKLLGYKGAGLPATRAAITWLMVAGFLFGFFNTFGLRAFKMPTVILTIIILAGLIVFGWLMRKPAAKQESTSEPPQ